MRMLAALMFVCCCAAQAVTPLADPSAVEPYLATRERREPGITPGAESAVHWLTGQPSRTPLAIVYLHGYSATRQEVHPLAEQVASALGANLFSTRLTGHGRDGKAMLEGTAAAWQADTREALAIGHTIGERVVIISTSTGGTLSTWLADAEGSASIAALVMISPNFEAADKALYLLDWPVVGPLLLWWFGEGERSWKPMNDAQARYWSWHYPWSALVELTRLMKQVETIDKSRITTPTMMIYSPRDQVVDPDAVRNAFEQWGAPRKRLVAYERSNDPSQHVLAGDIVSPGSTAELAQTIRDFLTREVLPAAAPVATAAAAPLQQDSDGKSM
jgi:esterase/lipase